MWNMVQDNALGGQYDKSPGDRREVTKGGVFEPIKLEIVIFDGQIESFTSKGGRLSSEKDSIMALAIEKMIVQNFTKKKEPEKPKTKQIEDGKTIDI